MQMGSSKPGECGFDGFKWSREDNTDGKMETQRMCLVLLFELSKLLSDRL